MKIRTINEAYADLLAGDPRCAITKTALRRLVAEGKIPSVKIGNRNLIDLEVCQSFFEHMGQC